MTSVEALITPAVMKWARESMGLRLDEAAKKIGRPVEDVEGWEDGSRRPTMAQLRKASEVYKRPMAVFYLPKPPRDFTTLRDFRSLPDSETRKFSADLALLIRAVDFRRRWLSDYLVGDGAEPLAFVGSVTLRTPPSQTAQNIRRTLEINTNEIKGTTADALRYWIGKAEAAGIFIFRSRDIPLDQARGFVMSDPYAPIVFINSRDAQAAQIFTLAHELAHVWLGHSGISNLELSGRTTDQEAAEIERYCNQAAAEVILEPAEFRQMWPRLGGENLTQQIGKAARAFRVSDEVIARRLLQEGIIDNQTYKKVRAEGKRRWEQEDQHKKAGPVRHSLRMATRNGHLFTRTIISGFRSGNISGRDASELLNVKINHFPQLAKEVGL